MIEMIKMIKMTKYGWIFKNIGINENTVNTLGCHFCHSVIGVY